MLKPWEMITFQLDIAPAIVAAGIMAAGALEGQRQSSAAASSATKQGREFARDSAWDEWQRQQIFSEQQNAKLWGYRASDIPEKVKGAKAAGIHPLFALGTSSSYSPTSYTSGAVAPQGFSGSYAGEGLAKASRHIGRGIMNKAAAAKAAEIHELQIQKMKGEIQLDQSALLDAASKRKLAEQSMYWGDSDPGITGEETKVYPYGTKQGLPLELRPLAQTARRSLPLRSEVIADDGYRYRIIDPDTGDEASQADLVAQMVLRHTRKARKAPGRELRIQFNRLASAIKRRWRAGLKSTRRRRER